MGVMTAPVATALAPLEAPGSSQHNVFYEVPIPLLDATTGNTDIHVHFTMVFDQRMDAAVLANSWYELVESWPMLAARVRTSSTAKSGLAYHVPSDDVVRHDIAMDAHLPAEKRQFYVCDQSQRTIRDYWSGAAGRVLNGLGAQTPFISRAPQREEQLRLTTVNAVKSFDEQLNADRPVFTVQSTHFADATLVTLSFSHVIGDGFCITSIVHAWTKLIRNASAEEVAPSSTLQQLASDNFADVDMDVRPQRVPHHYRLLGVRDKVRLMANVLYDVKIGRPEQTMEGRYIHLPLTYVRGLQDEAKEHANGDPIGRSDVILAWLVQNVVAASPSQSTRFTPITIINARKRTIAGHSNAMPTPFGGLATPAPLGTFTAAELARMPLGALARHIHRDLKRHAEPDNLRDLFHSGIHYGAYKRRQQHRLAEPTPFFCAPDSRFIGLTDWRALRFGEVDFAGAALDGADTAARVKAIQTSVSTPMSTRDRFALLGELDGSVWLHGTLSKAEWENKNGFGRMLQVGDDGTASVKQSRL